MIVRNYVTSGLKAQKLIAQGIALWYYAQCDSFALQGQKL